MAELSVIIPIYNADKYLEQCLESLMNQTYRNLEVICVNDGSVDRTASILKEFEDRDKRFVVINQKNQGAIQARKNAYKRASGRFITLVDADDWLEISTYETVMNCIKRDDSDVCAFNFYKNTETAQTSIIGYAEEAVIEDPEDIYKLSLSCFVGGANPVLPGRSEGWPWNKVYRREIYEKLERKGSLFVDDTRHFDDVLTNVRMLQECKKASVSPIYGYHFRVGNKESITGKYYATLPPKSDFLWYAQVGKELGWETVLSSVVVNLFWSYLTKHHYFSKENPMSMPDQLAEIRLLLQGDTGDDCYFPIKEAIEKCNVEWVSNRILQFLLKHHMVSANTLYMGVLVSRVKNRLHALREG